MVKMLFNANEPYSELTKALVYDEACFSTAKHASDIEIAKHASDPGVITQGQTNIGGTLGTYLAGSLAGDSSAEFTVGGTTGAQAQGPAGSVKRPPGRPRKFTGPGWDELSKAEYAIRANSEHMRLQSAKRKLVDVGLPLPPNPLDSVETPVNANPETSRAYQDLVSVCMNRENGIAQFKLWMNQQQTLIENAYARYAALNR